VSRFGREAWDAVSGDLDHLFGVMGVMDWLGLNNNREELEAADLGGQRLGWIDVTVCAVQAWFWNTRTATQPVGLSMIPGGRYVVAIVWTAAWRLGQMGSWWRMTDSAGRCVVEDGVIGRYQPLLAGHLPDGFVVVGGRESLENKAGKWFGLAGFSLSGFGLIDGVRVGDSR